MKNFERFVGIDWSGAEKPVMNRSIAIAICTQDRPAVELLTGPWSREKIGEWIIDLTGAGQRTLIGIDANFGFAQSVIEKQFGAKATYQDLWKAVESACHNAPNYFASGFWQAWPDLFWTHGKMPEGFTMPRRVVETSCGEAGLGWPESPFKLIGAKQVGKGGLAAMRMVIHLKSVLGDRVAIWPFEQNLYNSASIVITEIYPRQFLWRCGHGATKIRTAQDLDAALNHFDSRLARTNMLSDHDSDAIISAAGLKALCGNAQDLPEKLSHPPQLSPRIAQTEGWIFGVGI